MIVIAALFTCALVVTAWLALRGRIIVPGERAEPGGDPAAIASGTLGALPQSYADVPKLGPPLPGDLGKPILDAQRKGIMVPQPASAAVPVPDAADIERAERLAQARAAAQSPLLARSSGKPGESGEPASAVTPVATKAVPGPSDGSAVDPHRVEPPASPFTLSAGSIIPANLITGVRSDLPGIVTAQVSQGVWDSPTGQILLIPQGARLIGRYDHQTSFGQKRLRLDWQRLIFPDGSSLSLDAVPATDSTGAAGLEDRVNAHGWQLIQGALLGTVIGVGTELQFTGGDGLAQAVRQSGQQSFSKAGDRFASRALDIKPTLEIRAGAPVRLVVQRDLVLTPWKEGSGS